MEKHFSGGTKIPTPKAKVTSFVIVRNLHHQRAEGENTRFALEYHDTSHSEL